MFGSGDVHGPKHITRQKGILVNFNHRLGPLGFITTESELIPGNMGMKDQVEALKWVQRNIAAFGGDPHQVIITGFSSGSASVQFHYMSPLSEGLFHKGISHSGSALGGWALMKKGKDRTMKVARSIGCPTDSDAKMVACMKEKPGTEIVMAVKELQPWLYNPFSPFAPSVEPNLPGSFLAKNPVDYISSGEVRKLPWLVSTVHSEGLYPAAEFLREKEYLPHLDENWNELLPHILHYNDSVRPQRRDIVSQLIRKHYLKGAKLDESTFTKFVDVSMFPFVLNFD